MSEFSIFLEWLGHHLNTIMILVLATFVGKEIISKVPAMLHTPLMSGANAISGVTVVGGIYIVRTNPNSNVIIFLGSLAILVGMINVVGGFAVTNRMLDKFKKNNHKGK